MGGGVGLGVADLSLPLPFLGFRRAVSKPEGREGPGVFRRDEDA